MIDPEFSNTRNLPIGKKSRDWRLGEDKPIGSPKTDKEFKAYLGKEPDKEEEKKKPKKESEDKPKSSTHHIVKDTPTEKEKPSLFSLPQEDNLVADEPVEGDLMQDEPLVRQAPKQPVNPEEPPVLTPEGKETQVAKSLPAARDLTPEELVAQRRQDPNQQVKSEERLTARDLKPEEQAHLPKKESKPEEKIIGREFHPEERKEKPKFGENIPHKELEKARYTDPRLARHQPQQQEVAERPSIFSPYAYEAPKHVRSDMQFSQEMPDLAYVNPMNMGVPQAAIHQLSQTFTEHAPLPPPPDIGKLVEQMVENLTVMTTQDKTDTTVTIKHPPMFEGANINITSFKSASGEFNVTFDNLRPEAQKILQENIDSLKTTLQTKGYVVHIITTTTLAETQTFSANPQPSDRDSEEQGQEHSEQEEQQQEDQ